MKYPTCNLGVKNVKDVEQPTTNEQKKPLMTIVTDVLGYFVKEGLEPKEILMVLRELENEAMVGFVAEKLAGPQE